MVVITYVGRRRQSCSGLFLDINLLIYYAKNKIIYYYQETPPTQKASHKVFEPCYTHKAWIDYFLFF